MLTRTFAASAAFVGLAAAVPAPQLSPVSQIVDGQPQAPGPSGYTGFSAVPASAGGAAENQAGNVEGYAGNDAPYADESFTLTVVPTSFGLNSQVAAIYTTAPTTGPGAAWPIRSNGIPTGVTSHGPYDGPAPTTTGAVTTEVLGMTVAALPPNPTATYYNTNGELTEPEPVPYQPAGGLGTNGTQPRYMVNSDFDYESITLGLYQEWIELDLFNNGLATFSEEDFLAAGLTLEDIELIRFFAQQEEGHATLLSNMLGETAPPQCTYNYPFTNVREFVDFNQILTRWGESGVWGFINHLDSREVGQLLSQSIATEARQQMAFRQFSGLFPAAVWFETGIPQSWAWTYLAPYISSCPENTTRLAWQNFPALHVVNQANINRVSVNDTKDWERVDNRTGSPATIPPQDESCVNLNKTGYGCGPAISRNRSEPLTFPGKQIRFLWDAPGQAVGPNNSYITATSAGAPKYVAWANQLNLTYTDLTITGANEGYTYQPAGEVYQGGLGVVNDTTFIALTDTNEFFTPFNLSFINPHVVALGIFQAG